VTAGSIGRSRGYTGYRLTSLEQARRIATLASEKLGEDIVVIDMRPECSFTDYFVIVTARNARQTVAIYDEVHEKLKQEGRVIPRAVDGVGEGTWILADYLDVVLHVFTPEAREYYKLEELWNDLPLVEPDTAATA
jgi:ribosome-associated protein